MSGPASARTNPFLRPMATGELLDNTFKLFRRSWRVLVPIGLIGGIPTILMNGLLSAAPALPVDATTGDIFLAPILGLRADPMAAVPSLAPYFLFLLGSLFLTPLVQGAVIVTCSRSFLGQETTVEQALKLSLTHYWRLLGTFFLTGLFMMLAVPVALVAGLLFLAFITIPVALITLMVFWVFSSHTIVVEGEEGGTPALRRSYHLVKGRFWPLLGLGILFSLLTGVMGYIIGAVTVLPMSLVNAAVAPNPVTIWLTAILGNLTTAITMPFTLIGMTLAYYDTRMRKEGFDLELMANQQAFGPDQP